IVLDANLAVVSMSHEAERWLAEIGEANWPSTSELPIPVYSAAAGLARLENGPATAQPPATVRLRSRAGRWLALHASRPSGPAPPPVRPARTTDRRRDRTYPRGANQPPAAQRPWPHHRAIPCRRPGPQGTLHPPDRRGIAYIGQYRSGTPDRSIRQVRCPQPPRTRRRRARASLTEQGLGSLYLAIQVRAGSG